MPTTATRFPLSKHTGEVTLHSLSQACVFIYSSCGKWVFPLLLWSFPPTTTFTNFPAPRLLGSCLLWLACLFTVPWGIAPPPLWCSGSPALFAMCLFCYCLLFSFSFFPGWGLVCPGGYADLAQGCLWEYCMQLNSSCCLHLSKWFGCWCLVLSGSPPGFSI
jgi:hypothetical protein